MARHNSVNVIAFVQKEPLIKNGINGEEGMIALTTIMSPRDMGKAKTGYQCNSVHFCIRSDEKRILDIVRDLKLYEIVEVNGFIATKEVNKKAECPDCGSVNFRQDSCVAHGKEKTGGNMVYIVPISLRKIEEKDNEQDAFKYLHDHRDSVNRVTVLGNLTVEPIIGELNEGRKIYTRFQVAVSRKYFTKTASIKHRRTDYPWIYSYQRKAELDYKTLKSGDLVLIDGALQSRKYKEQYVCRNCGHEFDVSGRTLEILAYDTEYLRLSSFDEDEYPEFEDDEGDFYSDKKVGTNFTGII